MGRINIGEAISVAFNSIWTNKLRTFLTLLGVIIGVMTIITVVSVIQGLDKYVYEKMSFYGASDFSVTKFSTFGSYKDYLEQIKRKNLTLEDMEAIRKYCRNCELVGASVRTTRNVKFRSQYLKNVEIRGVTQFDHLIGSVIELEAGRHILKEDIDHSRFVCVIGADIKKELFSFLDPIGKRLKIGNKYFLIIGVAKERGKILGFSQDNFVRIPITTFQKIYGKKRSIAINIHTTSLEKMKEAQEEVRTVLRARRHLKFNEPDDFFFRTSETFIQFYKNATSSIYFAMIAISSIALLVGGIVIMNIMLVSVTERTKEIGIRMSIGARRKDILLQFLIESSIISGTGGIVGILLGFIIAKIVSATTSMPSALDPTAIIIAILVSTSVGLFFGLYPANKAAKLDPSVALRAEQ